MKKHSQCYDSCTSVQNIKKCIMDGHKIIVLMRGVPGSGKSFLAEELRSLNGGVVYSTDDYFMKNGEYKYNPDYLTEYHKKNQIRARDAMQADTNLVIVDNTNIRIAEMQPYVQQAAICYYEIYVVEPQNAWSRKAGECARRNSHGVSKDKINSMLDLMDTEREATLTNLLKGYSIMLDPPIECEPPESEPAKFHAQQQSTSTRYEPPPGFSGNGYSFTPIVSMQHIPKPTTESVTMRNVEIQTTEITVALSLGGFGEMFSDLVVEDYFVHQRNICGHDRKGGRETKERTSQVPIESKTHREKEMGDLDLLVCLYPTEDMSTLLHHYRKYGLYKTIEINLDVGVYPDYEAEIIKGAFSYEIAKALETGSFEHEGRPEHYSDANTTTSGSEDPNHQLFDQLRHVDVGTALFQQLEIMFGQAPSSSGTSTIAQLPVHLLRQIYDAVIINRTLTPYDEHIMLESDAEMARRLQQEENLYSQSQEQMNGAQYLNFQELKKDFPSSNHDALMSLYASTGYNDTETRRLIGLGPAAKTSTVYITPRSETTRKLANTDNRRGVPSFFTQNYTNGFERVHIAARELIEKSNENKQKREEIMKEVYKHSGDAIHKKNHAIVLREKAHQYSLEEKRYREEATELLMNANENSKELDLHYLLPTDALKLVKKRLAKYDRQPNERRGRSNKKVVIITGYGKSSGGTAIVKKHIITWLTNKNYQYYFQNPGCIEVMCK